MHKVTWFGIAAVAAIALVWSISTLAKSKFVHSAEVAKASSPIAPHEIMVRHDKSLPTEYWSHPFWWFVPDFHTFAPLRGQQWQQFAGKTTPGIRPNSTGGSKQMPSLVRL
jgi:hypothetical protein